MFIITDLTREIVTTDNFVLDKKSSMNVSTRTSSLTYHVHDIKTGADIIVGITGEVKDYQKAIKIMGNMRFGDSYRNHKYLIECIKEEINMNDLQIETCPNCGNEFVEEWNVDTLGYKTYCPVCGNTLMLCDACIHSKDGLNEGGNYCDWGRYGPERCFRCNNEPIDYGTTLEEAYKAVLTFMAHVPPINELDINLVKLNPCLSRLDKFFIIKKMKKQMNKQMNKGLKNNGRRH